MPTKAMTYAIMILLATVIACLNISSVMATNAGVEFKEFWVRETPPAAGVTVAYGKIINHSEKKISIQALPSRDFKQAEFHETRILHNKARMTSIPQLLLTVGQQLELQPSAVHLMLMEPTRLLRENDQVELIFEVNGKIQRISVRVAKASLTTQKNSVHGQDVHQH